MTNYPPPVSAIASDKWQLLAHNVEHKQNLLAHARACGVPVASPLWGCDTDPDLHLSWLSDETGIISMPKRIGGHRVTTLISGPDFFTLCTAYAVAHGYPTQPVGELVDAQHTPPLTPR